MITTKVAGDLTTESLDGLSLVQMVAVYRELTGRSIMEELRELVRKAEEAAERQRTCVLSRLRRGKKLFDLPPRLNAYRDRYVIRLSTLQGQLVEMLLEGATFEEVRRRFSYQTHQAYNRIWRLHRYHGFAVKEDPQSGIIRITQPKSVSK